MLQYFNDVKSWHSRHDEKTTAHYIEFARKHSIIMPEAVIAIKNHSSLAHRMCPIELLLSLAVGNAVVSSR